MVEILVPFVAAVLALLVIPGPDMALVVASGIAYGKRGAFFSSLGISCGGMLLALAVAVILATALSISTKILTLVQLAGCLYLLYIAVTTIYSEAPNEVGQTVAEPSTGNLFLRGVVANISNPKALIFFSAFIPQFIPATSSNAAVFAFALGALLCLIGFGVNFTIGVTGSMLSGLNKVAFARRTWTQWIVCIVFVAISLVFVTQLFFRL